MIIVFAQDKNPFSGFSEEHLSKLDEFLSSEEAKKILQQTSEGDFNTMSELAGSSGGMPAGGDLKLDLFDVSCHCVIIRGDFSNTMSELAGSSGGMPTGGDLKLDLFDVSCHCVIIRGRLLQHHVGTGREQ